MEVSEGSMVSDRFQIMHKIGKGGFGEVYAAYDFEHDNVVAIKIEKEKFAKSSVDWEKMIYDHLWSKSFPIGIPKPLSHEKVGGDEKVLVMPLLGASLRDIWKANGPFSIRSIANIGIQVLNRIEHNHKHGILHMDIKPENLLTGRGADNKTVYLVDYGLAHCFVDKFGIHKPYRDNVGFKGTPVFSSIYTDARTEHSLRDDIESLMYTLLILKQGWLPWCDGDWKNRDSYPEDFEDLKLDCRESAFEYLPKEFQRAWKIVRDMDFGDTPRYDKLRELFSRAAERDCEDDGLRFSAE